ncbi:MFS multidrug transporter [Polychaeton citri CBS 116435]|uniref:MFS multidrug transporter n=1 Tax=Polychaeton citri CBS 116435 TaxID=1314669 RepID=A0A9P4UL20_9PEZI|nr:MFS multidrug transporter [Polychaeton citri CBS 116435]
MTLEMEKSAIPEPVTAVLVTFDGPDDPLDPKNWPRHRKLTVVFLTSLGGLITLISGPMMAPALTNIGSSLDVSPAEANLALSVFVLAFAFGPLVLGPCSEAFGRKYVWIAGSVWYMAWNLGCGFADSKGLMIAARFFAGIGASAEFAISGPVLSDCWRPEERGKWYAVAQFLPFLGPAIGPILGGVITGSIGWRWLFWVLSAVDALLIIMFVILFNETYPPIILSQKARRLSKETGRCHRVEPHVVGNDGLSGKLRTSMTRPYRLFITQPILQLMSLFLAYNFGFLYLTLTTFANVWIDRYGETEAISGLNYIALAIGYTIGSQVGGPAANRIWKHLQSKYDGKAAPEYRVPLMIPSVVLIPTGLLWYGWAVNAGAHWAIVDVGIGVFGCGIVLGTTMMQAYVLDAFPLHGASAQAASQFLRSIFAFVFPIFAPKMYESLGYGWGNSLLALLYLAFGVPAPLILWGWGAGLRERATPQH